MNRHISTSSAASAASRLQRSGQGLGQSGSARSTGTAGKSSPKTLWATPSANQSISASVEAMKKEADRLHPQGRWTLGTQIAELEYSKTSSTSTDEHSKESISSQADFLASLSALPGTEEARQMTVRSGRRCSALLQRHDPLGCLAKTFLELSRWNSTTCFLNWKESATPQGRLLFRLVPSMPGTDETESGSSDAWFLTPSANEDAAGTPNGKMQKMLENSVAVRGLMPTPNTMDYLPPNPDLERKGQRKGRTSYSNLRDRVQFATPQGRDYRTGEAHRWERPEDYSRNLNDQIATENVGGSLSPDWVEWLMGYPVGWTNLTSRELQQGLRNESIDSKDSVTPSSRKSRMKSSKKSGK